jgi:hypothetical protein
VSQRFLSGTLPERYVEVDAARLLLILVSFASPIDDALRNKPWYPPHDAIGRFTPEYYLHKLDFLVRYPGYLAYELMELFRMGVTGIADRDEVMALTRTVLRDREPELLTDPFRKFWRGAYERLDEVEGWWHARRLVYRALEPKGGARPQKHYFLSASAQMESERLVSAVDHARWYANRIDLIHRFFGSLSAADIKELQYRHLAYRQAQLDETIPDLPLVEIVDNFVRVFGEPLGVDLGQ